jgi:large subunit ribosomal protein L5e
MPFIKVVKNKQYFKRYQVQYRRRREGKTDYHRRKKLVAQDKNKYNSPKYRFVVRITNADVVCQIAYAKIVGDVILAAAYAHELTNYGLPVGHTNYAGCYATGLLLARRLLHKLKLDTKYQGKVKADGEVYNVEELADGPGPFRALLDVGLARTTTGARIFAALKGAVDGGLEIPHSENRFRGYDASAKKYDPAAARGYILGAHVSEYMAAMKEDDEGKYKTHFSQYLKHGINESNLEAKIVAAHKAIRANPAHVTKKSAKAGEKKRHSRQKMSLAQRKDRVRQKLASMAVKKAKAQ